LTTDINELIADCNVSTRHLKPGGWCEFKDWDFNFHSTDNSLPPDSNILKYHQLLFKASDIMHRDWKPGAHLKKWVKEAGFENIEEQVLVVPIGTWPKDKHYVSLTSVLPCFSS
jgi:hypothetical protein